MSIFLTDTRKMKSMLFFLVLFGVIFIAWSTASQKDGFQDTPPEGADPSLTVPLVSPRYQTLTNGEVKPFMESSAVLLSPPPGQSASVNSQPAEDPAAQKADAKRIQSVYESLQGFFKTDAPAMQKMGDPSIQLPLSTAKSDLARLNDELTVLKRNPGIESTLTQEDVNGVEANLGYLQKKWRLSANANSGASPIPPSEEGFDDMSAAGVYGWFRSFFGGAQEGFQGGSPPPGSQGGSPPPGSQGGSPPPGSQGGSPPPGSQGGSPPPGSQTGSNTKVTLQDLKDLKTKIQIEIVRLQASGTTDENTQARIKVLTAIVQNVSDIILDVGSGVRTIDSVPLTKADIAKFLPAMSNPNTAMPELIKDWGLQSVLSSLFPNYALGDLSGATVSKALFDKYMTDMTQNLSWDVSFNYKGQAEKDIAANYASAMNDARYVIDTTGQPVASNSATVANTTNSARDTSSPYRGVFESVITSITGQAPASLSVANGETSSGESTSESSNGEASPFDWKARSSQICIQINARGMNAYDFGCMKEGSKVRDDFSWRGYTRMICTRLGTNYDPGVPELCGCPPPSWIGWRP